MENPEDNDDNLQIPNDALDDGELGLEDNENVVIDENDSNSDNRFPEVNEGGWISWFCQLEGNEFFVEIDEDFIKNKKNLIGIKNCKEYINTLLSKEIPNENTINEDYMENLQNIKEIYGLIHKRFITTQKGLALMREKYLNGIYGHCPRILCEKQILLPMGLSEDMKFSRVKVFCPVCEEVYKPRARCNDIDGAYFGYGFPQIFLMNYPDLNPKLNGPVKGFIPKIYGFRVFGKKGSKYYCKDKESLRRTMKRLDIKRESDDEEDFK